MTVASLHDHGWSLEAAADKDIDEIMTWFPDAEAVNLWGGPGFRFPFSPESFRKDCKLSLMDSYSLFEASGALAAFGQSYERDGRGHLARLVSNPAMRGRGAGRQLIRMILKSLDQRCGYGEYSLFVYRHNVPAYQCYLSLGFVVQEYPDDAPWPDKCYFLTKRRRE
jgi:ribosomal protein S18 acetylase RimI-like enzyme